MSYVILRNANVKAFYDEKTLNSESFPCLGIIVNDEYSYVFNAKSPENKLIFQFDLDTISKIYTGGTFVFFKGVLRDYRRGDYKGFIHSDESIKKLSDIIGVTEYSSNVNNNIFNRFRSYTNNGLMMGGEWKKFDLDVKELGMEGAFENKLIYSYSVFSPNITSSLEIQRLVCLNGMIRSSGLCTYEVPVINNWEENLETISKRIQPEVNGILSQRFLQMVESRCNLADLSRVDEVILERIDSIDNIDQRNYAQALSNVTNFKNNLSLYYSRELLDSKNLAYFDSDLTKFDVYNILTEVSSHTVSSSENDKKIQMIANRMLFDENDKLIKSVEVSLPKSDLSDPKRAFFGEY